MSQGESTCCHLKNKFFEKCVNYLNWKSVDIFPKAFSTINLHMMLHLPNQVLRHGALSYTSMFTFEARNHTFSTYMKGTAGHITQIA